ncbi:hypothetical protein C8A03DRAFT_39626, partial [Achaetomium macrosporum]
MLREAVGPLGEGEADGVLRRMCSSLDRVMDRARAATAAMPGGHAALFEINRKKADVKPSKPFDSRMEDDTWARYKDGDLFDEFEEAAGRPAMDEPDRSAGTQADPLARGIPDRTPRGGPGRLARSQPDRSVRNGSDRSARGEPDQPARKAYEEKVDRLCLDMVIAFFDHQYKHTQYENAIINGLAAMGLREDGG